MPKKPATYEDNRRYPSFESAAGEDEKLVARAELWAGAWQKGERGNEMDKHLKGLTLPQQNRVIIMGQRIAAGIPPIQDDNSSKA